MKKYSHLFFDLDHTLWDTDRNAEESLSEIFEELELCRKGIPDFDVFHGKYKAHNERLWGLYAENKVGREAVRTHRFLLTLKDFNIDDDRMANEIADRFVKRTPFKKHLIPGTKELLDSLHPDYRLNIITNGFSETQHIKLRESGIAGYFDHVIISEEVGVHKPDPKIFHHALQIAGAASAGNCMMIGDTFQTDVFGALNAGLQAVHYAPSGSMKHDAPVITITSLRGLLEHL
ncbi:MAG: YjjG family noncanonical pyrimidine nucleotidase [Bacteroidia bacterium]|nr:YjjG family noncanonical pyrimidine nucleotidase [Bacteroidia bacterium]